MQEHHIYYLQQMGYTVWRSRKIKNSSCQCVIANHGLDQATLLCCLDEEPNKSEKDLWIFLSMAFDFGQQYHLTTSKPEYIQHSVCPSCVESWLAQSSSHHAIVFGNCLKMNADSTKNNLLIVPGLAQMIDKPNLKKRCFIDIRQFLCQQHLVI